MGTIFNRAKMFRTVLLAASMFFGLASVSHADTFLCGNKNKQGAIGVNSIKVTVQASSMKQGIAKAKKAYKNKGHKVKNMGCTPTTAGKTKAQSGANYMCGNLNKKGMIGANSVKVPVKAASKKQAIARAKKSYSAKGYKVRKMGCTPM